ncbi:MAG: hypothetical protein HZA31_08045 [Opitutae bacterium]|nr:hypothetical protein [Opitutae bacterium]
MLRNVFLFLLSLSALVPAFGQFGSSSSAPKLVSQDELSRQISQGKHYNFDVSSGGYLVDGKGTIIRNSELKDYLTKHQYAKDAFYVLWLGPESPKPDRLTNTLEALRQSGVTKVAARRKKSGDDPRPALSQPEDLAPLAPPPAPPPKPKTPAASAAPSTSLVKRAGDPLPAMNGRSPALRPQELPAGIRYKIASDAAVTAAAESITRLLLAPGTPPKGESFFSTAVVVQSGAWKRYRKSSHLGQRESTRMPGVVTISGKDYKQESCLLRDLEEIAYLEERLREQIAKNGGGTVRALTTQEMSQWGIFAGTDIDEPTLAIPTKNGKHLYVVGFGPQGAIVLDDLSELP